MECTDYIYEFQAALYATVYCTVHKPLLTPILMKKNPNCIKTYKKKLKNIFVLKSNFCFYALFIFWT